MKIQPIASNQQIIRKKDEHNLYNTNPSFHNAGKYRDLNAPLTRLVFDQKKLRILERSRTELIDLAEKFYPYFVNYSSSNLEKFCGSETDLLKNLVIGIIKDEDIVEKRTKIFSKIIEEVLAKRKNLEKEISRLEIEQSEGVENIVSKKNQLQLHFLSLLDSEKKGTPTPLTNGILIYGNNSKKDDFISWLKDKANLINKKITYDTKEPMNTIKEISKIALDAEKNFQFSNIRTLLEVENLDSMLTNKNSQEGLKIIARFKGLIERLSENYHTTLIMQTNKPLSDFEEASLATHRFGLQLELKEGISEDHLKLLNAYKTEMKRLEAQANSNKDYYYKKVLY